MKIDQLEPLDEMINNEPNFDKTDIFQLFREQCMINDRFYALPIYGTTQIMYYRKDLFREAGLNSDILNTWEGLEKAASNA